MSEPIAYGYEADNHCPACTEKRFGRNERGFIAEGSTDNEGNPVGAQFAYDETPEAGLYCGDCGAEIAEPRFLEWHGDYVSLRLHRDDAEGCSHSGRCDEDVASALRQPYIATQFAKLDPDAIRSELRECGAWDAAELADEDQNRARLLWIAAGNLTDAPNA